MGNVIVKRLDKALSGIDEARAVGRADDIELMFPKPDAEHTFDILKYVADPCGNTERGPVWRTDNPFGKAPASPAPKWTVDQVWSAMARVIKAEARRMSGGAMTSRKGGKMDFEAFKDLCQEAASYIVASISRGEDQGRDSNSFVTWMKGRIHSAVRGGAGAGPEYREAQGFLNKVSVAKDSQAVAKVLGKIDPKDRVKHADVNRKSRNPLGKWAPTIWSVGQRLMQALDSTDKVAVKAVKVEIEKLKEQIGLEYEQYSGLGAFTGVHDPVSLPHSGEDRDEFFQTHGYEPTSMPGPVGDEIENPGMQNSNRERDPVSIAGDKEIIKRALDVALTGFTDADGRHVPPMPTREYRAMIRLAGINNYSGRGEDEDPEFYPERRKEAMRTIMQTGQIVVNPVSAEEAARLAKLSARDEAEFGKIVAQDSEFRSKQFTKKDVSRREVLVDGPPIVIKFDVGPGGRLNRREAEKVDAVVDLLSYSSWVRRGCPALEPGEINKEGILGAGGTEVSAGKVSELIGRFRGTKDATGALKDPGLLRRIGQHMGYKTQPGWMPDVSSSEKRNEDRDRNPTLYGLLNLNEALRAMRTHLFIEGCDQLEYRLVFEVDKTIRRRLCEYLDLLAN